jgi:hypothetical protein
MSRLPLSIDHPGLFAAACAIALLTAVVARLRRPAVSPLTATSAGLALLLLALAAGGTTWRRPIASEVAVMVDLSASTRGATYRHPRTLDQRIHQLLGDTPYRVTYFADQNTAAAPAGTPLPDLPGDVTRYAPPPAPAVLLFSDARFDLPPAAPPTFVVADPALDQPDDAAVTRLERRSDELAATVSNTGRPRRLALGASSAATRPTEFPIDTGSVTVTHPLGATDAPVAVARLNPADRWPENDGLTLLLAPASRSEQWFVSSHAAPGAPWREFKPDALPTDPAAYLAPSVIVLDNLAASDLAGDRLHLLEQYVRDLGGSLVITGGDRAFGAGLYTGTALESLSPLASVPPAPAVHWAILADASGSMSQSAGEQTRWQRAASAVVRLLPLLPPEDPVSVGSFAAELTWWSTGKTARETAALPLPPARVVPTRPTNLVPAIRRVVREVDGALPTELLVVSDADVTIDDPDALAKECTAKRVRLHVLAIGEGSGLPTLRRLTSATGGKLRTQFDPARWATEVRQLLADAAPPRLSTTPVTLKFLGDFAPLPPRDVSPWNRTWLKPSASEIARGTSAGEPVPLGARWTVGAEGTVVSLGFTPTPAELGGIVARVAKPPRDPRFRVTWDAGPQLRVRVDATTDARGGNYRNDLPLRLELTSADGGKGETHDLPQVAPGRYEFALSSPRSPAFATVRLEGRVIDRLAVAGRYAPEFDAVGNDYDAMRQLAARTGGRVIDRAWQKPLDIPFPRRDVSLTTWLLLAASVALGAALARWRFG